jgi:hypothetical protein
VREADALAREGMAAARAMVARAQPLIDWAATADPLLATLAAAELEQLARKLRRDAEAVLSIGSEEPCQALLTAAWDCRCAAGEIRALAVSDGDLRKTAASLARIVQSHPEESHAASVGALLDAAIRVGYSPALFAAVEAFAALPSPIRERLLRPILPSEMEAMAFPPA